jgi:hypothetical protein
MTDPDPNPFSDGCTVIHCYGNAKVSDEHWLRQLIVWTMGLSAGCSDVSNVGTRQSRD